MCKRKQMAVSNGIGSALYMYAVVSKERHVGLVSTFIWERGRGQWLPSPAPVNLKTVNSKTAEALHSTLWLLQGLNSETIYDSVTDQHDRFEIASFA